MAEETHRARNMAGIEQNIPMREEIGSDARSWLKKQRRSNKTRKDSSPGNWSTKLQKEASPYPLSSLLILECVRPFLSNTRSDLPSSHTSTQRLVFHSIPRPLNQFESSEIVPNGLDIALCQPHIVPIDFLPSRKPSLQHHHFLVRQPWPFWPLLLQ